MVERLRVTRQQTRTFSKPRVSTAVQPLAPKRQEPQYSRATQSRISKAQAQIKFYTGKVDFFQKRVLEAEARIKAEEQAFKNKTGRYTPRTFSSPTKTSRYKRNQTKAYQNKRKFLYEQRRKEINRRQQAQSKITIAQRNLSRAKQGKTSLKQAKKVAEFTKVTKIVRRKPTEGGTYQVKINKGKNIPTRVIGGGDALDKANILVKAQKQSVKNALRKGVSPKTLQKELDAYYTKQQKLLKAGEQEQFRRIAFAFARDFKKVQAQAKIPENKQVALQVPSKPKTKVSLGKQRILGTPEQKVQAFEKAAAIRDFKTSMTIERLNRDARSQKTEIRQTVANTIKTQDLTPSQLKNLKILETAALKSVDATTFIKKQARGLFIEFPREVVSAIDKLTLLAELKAKDLIDPTAAQQERLNAQAAARQATRAALKDPLTYVFALLGRPRTLKASQPVISVSKVTNKNKLPKTGSKSKPNTLFVDRRTGSVRVSDSAGRVRSAGRIKNADLITSAKINKAVKLSNKVVVQQQKLNQAQRAVLRGKATKKQTQLIQKRERALVEKKAESFIRKQTREFEKAKRYNKRQIESLGFKSESEFLKYQKASPKGKAKLEATILRRLNTTQIKRLARRQVTAKKARTKAKIKRLRAESPLGKGLAELTKNFNKQLKQIRDIVRKNKAKKLKLDRAARKLGFSDHAELLFWRRTTASASKGSKIARLRLQLFEKRFKARKSKLARLKEKEIKLLIRQAKDVVVVAPKTRKLSKAKRSAKQIRRKEQPVSNFQFTINGQTVNPNKVIDLSPTPKTTTSVSAATPQGLVTVLKNVAKTKRPKPRVRVKTKAKTLQQLSKTKALTRIGKLGGVAARVRLSNGRVLNQNQFSRLSPDTTIIYDVVSATKPKSTQVVKLLQATAQKVTTTPKLVSKKLIPRTVRRKPAPKIKKKPKPVKLPKLKIDPREFKGGHVAYVKQGSQWLRANKNPLTKAKAAALGKYVVDNSTSASYIIGQMKGSPVKVPKVPRVLSSTFRKPVRTSRLKPQVRIEKRKYRINTKGEKRGLKAAKVIKQVRKRRKKK